MTIQDVDDVTGAPDEPEIDLDASAEAHAPVLTGSDEDHVTGVAVRRESLRRTVIYSKQAKEDNE